MIYTVKYSKTKPSWKSFGNQENISGLYLLPTDPVNNKKYVPEDKIITVTFSNSMDTNVTPTLSQVGGTDPSGWSFQGWSSTHVQDDTAGWAHNDWLLGDTVTMNLTTYQDTLGRKGDPYEWSFTTRFPNSTWKTFSHDSNNTCLSTYSTGNNGKEIWGFETEAQVRSSPTLDDLDNDGIDWEYVRERCKEELSEDMLDDDGNLYFVHHYYEDGEMIEADIYVAYRR